MIDERPKIVDEKSRIGDWETDTIVGKDHKQAVVSLVERCSKLTKLYKVTRRTAQQVSNAILKCLEPISHMVKTITADNGSEFAYHEQISKALDAEFYFAHPYSSWERGVNEKAECTLEYMSNESSA